MKMMMSFTTGPSVCSHEWKCDQCGAVVQGMEVHDCGIVPPPREVEVFMVDPELYTVKLPK